MLKLTHERNTGNCFYFRNLTRASGETYRDKLVEVNLVTWKAQLTCVRERQTRCQCRQDVTPLASNCNSTERKLYSRTHDAASTI